MNMGRKSLAAPEPSTRKLKHNKCDASSAPSDCAGATVLFWKEDGEHGFLCQWYRCTFTDPEHDGLTFTSAEQYMMWGKAMLFGDLAVAAKIMSISSPRKQKGLARDVANFDQSRWAEERSGIVRTGN